MSRLIYFILVLVVGLALGWGIANFFQSPDNRVTNEEGQILLEKIDKVAKLVTVEGYFSELYSYKDYYKFDIWPLRKKALIRVKARVVAGIDMEKLTLEAIEETRTIRLSGPLKSDILYVETDLDYYDLTQGTFNAFTEGDYTRLNQKSKQYVLEAAYDSDLLTQAEQQAKDLLETLRFLIEASGWIFEYDAALPGTKKSLEF